MRRTDEAELVQRYGLVTLTPPRFPFIVDLPDEPIGMRLDPRRRPRCCVCRAMLNLDAMCDAIKANVAREHATCRAQYCRVRGSR